MSWLDELEQEELAAESENRYDENKGSNTAGDDNHSDEGGQAEDEEYACIMSWLDKLEQEELATESDNNIDEDKRSNTTEYDNESDEDGQAKDDFNEFPDHISLSHNIRYSEELTLSKSPKVAKDKNTS